MILSSVLQSQVVSVLRSFLHFHPSIPICFESDLSFHEDSDGGEKETRLFLSLFRLHFLLGGTAVFLANHYWTG